jgi:hypothetical protein
VGDRSKVWITTWRASFLQINARKSKRIQAKQLAFPWFSLAESGLFNGLWRIQAKISPRSPKHALVVRTGGLAANATDRRRLGIHPDQGRHHGMIVAAILALCNKMSDNSESLNPQPASNVNNGSP